MFKSKGKNFEFSRRGFTIIELLISMAVFGILIGIISAIFINSLKTQRLLAALIAANDNASIALEQMAREVRIGSGFCVWDVISGACDTGNSTGGPGVAFTNAYGESVVYKLKAGESSIMRSEDGGGTFSPITGNNVVIRDLEFRLIHEELSAGDDWPPRIAVIFKVSAKDREELSQIFTNFQTTLSSRQF